VVSRPARELSTVSKSPVDSNTSAPSNFEGLAAQRQVAVGRRHIVCSPMLIGMWSGWIR
jgi:hypothetical protein